ncbi:MAG: hypothetical protein MK081_13180 [Flavobacteriales bacterium]|nr:hypothetical protein [Flavobacteriales bacterium]
MNASAQTAEVRTYGGFQADEGREILETPTGYLIVGTTASPENGNNDIYVVHILEDLTVDWSTTLGGAGADQGRSAVMTNEGDFLILGQTSLGENGGYDIVVYRIDASGNQLWESNSEPMIGTLRLVSRRGAITIISLGRLMVKHQGTVVCCCYASRRMVISSTKIPTIFFLKPKPMIWYGMKITCT